MNIRHSLIISFSILLVINACDSFRSSDQGKTIVNSITDDTITNLLTDIEPLYEDGDVNAVIEIPAGTLEKWELDKTTGHAELEYLNGKPRIINYLGYPGNYGMIPQTLLAKEHGGDGDPLDIIVLGPPVKRDSVVKCKIIGVLHLLDGGEQDDKLLAVSNNSPLYGINDIKELSEGYPGVPDILELWFTNYKGKGIMESGGYGERSVAIRILKNAINEYKEHKSDNIKR